MCTSMLGNNDCDNLLSLKLNSDELTIDRFSFSGIDDLFFSDVEEDSFPNIDFFSSEISRFEVLEAEYATNGELLRFAADFEYVEGNSLGDPFATGRIRYNSAVPLPEPTETGLLAFGVFAIVASCRRRNVG